ncbi:MAG: radical SAM protein [Clostridia bacterium]|nr:radical SAM protein [Clostridia bacterium]
MKECTLCPRECKKDRITGTGYCGESAEMRVAKIMLHRWEEPCISGNDRDRGSGAIFFSGCPLHCIYCQNRDISSGGTGKIYTPALLAEAIKELESAGAYNINFVTPTHFLHRIIEALEIYRPAIPTVFNTSGYEKADTLEALRGYADIFLADLKYGGEELARHYSNAPDYLSVALSAIEKMIDITGPCQFFDDGMMKKGVIVRHLVLPGGRHDSVNALKALKEAVGTENILLSLMSQYTPDFAPKDCKPLSRRVTTFEYEFVRDAALDMGFEGFGQDKNSATRAYTPEF